MRDLRVVAVDGLPEFTEGMRAGAEVAARAKIADGDVIVISQKVVSKAEGRTRRLGEVEPGPEARRIADRSGKDPALVELILEESQELIRAESGVIIAETRHGFICANAGIDSSNLPEEGMVALLPIDPDRSARRIRGEISEASGAEVAIGCAGLVPLDDWRGRADFSGRELAATVIAVADQAAAAADLVRDKLSRTPVALVRGLDRFVTTEDGPGAVALRRPAADDLFR